MMAQPRGLSPIGPHRTRSRYRRAKRLATPTADDRRRSARWGPDQGRRDRAAPREACDQPRNAGRTCALGGAERWGVCRTPARDELPAVVRRPSRPACERDPGTGKCVTSAFKRQTRAAEHPLTDVRRVGSGVDGRRRGEARGGERGSPDDPVEGGGCGISPREVKGRTEGRTEASRGACRCTGKPPAERPRSRSSRPRPAPLPCISRPLRERCP